MLVEETLGRAGDQLTEPRLAIEVFGRRESSFDPRTDAIVRSELSRVRAKLKDYYEGEGQNDPVLIEVPMRSLIPVFSDRGLRRTAAPEPAGGRLRWKTIPALICAVTALAFTGSSRTLKPAGANSGQSEPPGQLTSLAVLPFVNEGPDTSFEYFSDGLTDELIHRLSEVEGLRVVSRTSVFEFKGRRQDVRKIGKQLNVSAVLEGTVRKLDNRLRITTQLVNVADGCQLDSDIYQVALEDVFTVQEQIARRVVNDLRVRQVGGRGELLVKRYTQNAEAYDLYLKGLYHENKRSEWELREAISLFERAIEVDPHYAPAYSGLADSYTLLTLLDAISPKEAMSKAKALAERGVREGGDLSEAHTSLGAVRALYERDWAGAEREFQRAVELDPGDAAVRESYAMHYLVPQGRLEAALAQMQRAQQLDPLSNLIAMDLGLVHQYSRHDNQAIGQYERALRLDPVFRGAHLRLASAYEHKAMLQEALKTLDEGDTAPEDGRRIALRGAIAAVGGRAVEARMRLAQLQQLSRSRYVSGYYPAVIEAAMGEKSQALDSLDRAARERCPLVAYLKVDPRFDTLRSEPRFNALLKELGLVR